MVALRARNHALWTTTKARSYRFCREGKMRIWTCYRHWGFKSQRPWSLVPGLSSLAHSMPSPQKTAGVTYVREESAPSCSEGPRDG